VTAHTPAIPRSKRLVSDGLIVAVAFILGFGLTFLDSGVYWDDWVWFRQPWSVLADISRQLGSLWPAWTLAAPFQSQDAMWATRAIAMLAYLLAALWFLGLLRDVGVDRTTRLVMALVFATLPVNGARIPVSTAAYGVALALFMGGFRLVSLSYHSRRTWLRVAAAVALLLSLRAASLGVLLLVVYAYVIWREGAVRTPGRWVRALARRGELLAVPIVYLLLTAFVFVPHGEYAGYNEVTRSAVFTLPKTLTAAMWHSLVAPVLLGVKSIASPWGIVSAALILGLVWVAMRGSAHRGCMARRDAALWVAAGVALVAIAVVPYLIVGKMPALSDFESRHQLVVPVGAALGLGAGIRLVFGPSRRGSIAVLVAASVLCGGFIAADASNSLSYLREHYKHVALMDLMRESPAFQKGTTFLFDDATTELNANRRTSVRDYEYAGMMAETFGDQTRFGADVSDFESRGMGAYRQGFTSLYKMGDYVEVPPQYVVEVRQGPVDLSADRQVLSLLLTERLRPDELHEALRGTLTLTVEGL